MTDINPSTDQDSIFDLKKQLQDISTKLEDLVSRVDHQEDELNSVQETIHQGGYGYFGATSAEEYNDPEDVPPPLFQHEKPDSARESSSYKISVADDFEVDSADVAKTSVTTFPADEELLEPQVSDDELRRQKVMSFLDHLEDLRWVLFKSALAVAIFVGLSLFFSDLIYDLFMHPLKDYIVEGKVQLIYKSPLSAFMIFMKMGVTGGLVLGFPFMIYFIWGFVSPGLRNRERRYVFWALITGTIFFFVGGFLGYLFIPMGLPFLLSFAQEGVSNFWPVETYMGFCTNLVIAFGAMFEMPVLLALLIKLDIVSSEMLKKHRAMAVVVMFVVAAMLTPPDVYSQIAVACPMVVFYEMGIIYARRKEKKKLKDLGTDGV